MKLRDLLSATALVGGTSMFMMSAASAQTAQTAVAPQTEADSAAVESDEIVVTGSRIRRPELENLEPTLAITEQYFRDRNITNVANALNELPQFRGSVTPSGVQASLGSGVNFVNAFGLGSNRTLTLVNGRRVVSSNLPSLFGPGGPGLQVDLNIIPAVLIERIDNVSIGGAPVYGSDAIAGTVNLILKTRFDGAEFGGTAGVTERGDNFTYNLSGVVGQNFAEGRGNITVALAFDDVSGLRSLDRRHRRDAIGTLDNCRGTAAPGNDGRLNPNIPCNNGANDGVPGRLLFRNLRSPFLSTGGVIFNGDTGASSGLQFGPDGRLLAIAPGTRQTGFFQSGGNTYNTIDQTSLLSDLRRFTANVFGSYEITDGVELYTELLYYKARSQEQGTNPAFNTFVFDPSVSGGLTFDTATVPFLNEVDRQRLLGAGITSLNLSRSNEDLFDNGAITETELKRGVVGVRGDFAVGQRTWNYDVSLNYGTNAIDNLSEEINQQRFINAVSIAQGPNGPVCSTTPTVPVGADQPVQPVADPNCQPLNLFGVGQASRAALDYIREFNRNTAQIDQVVVNANVGGDLFDLWAGPIAFNAGYEHRNERASFSPSSFSLNGGGRSAPFAPASGSFSLNEVFGEVLVPLVSAQNDIPVITSAEAFGRVRYVDNSIAGGFLAWAAGGRVGLFDMLDIRGNFTRSFRSPSITELFLPLSPTFPRPADLCAAANRNAGPVPDIRSRNCLAFIQATGNDPATYVLLASQASVSGLSGGNIDLTNEKADSWTVGAVLRPTFLRGFSLNADYVNIRISDPIADLDEIDLSNACFDNANFDLADPINGNQFCSQLGFGANGQVPNDPANPAIQTGFVNGQRIDFEGVTGGLDYQTRLDGVGLTGTLNVGADALYVIRRQVDITGVAPVRTDGILGDPKISGQARVIYSDTNWGVGTYVNFVGRQLTSRQNRGPNPNDTREFDHYDPYATVNLNLFYRTDEGYRFNVAVTNLLDRIGQEYFGFIVPASINDNLGRRFSVSVSKSF